MALGGSYSLVFRWLVSLILYLFHLRLCFSLWLWWTLLFLLSQGCQQNPHPNLLSFLLKLFTDSLSLWQHMSPFLGVSIHTLESQATGGNCEEMHHVSCLLPSLWGNPVLFKSFSHLTKASVWIWWDLCGCVLNTIFYSPACLQETRQGLASCR